MSKRSRDSAGFALFLLMFCASELAAATGSTYPQEILILPEMVRFDDMGRVLSVQYAVDASRPILIREERGTLRTRPLATRLVGIQGASQARLSTSRLAAVLRPGKGARQGDQTYPASEFFVFDSLGSERWRASGVVNFSWSPDGRRLLFVRGVDRVERLPAAESCGVWDSQTNVATTLARGCRDIGWLTADTALVAEPSSVVAISISSGARIPTRFRGVDISSDRRYALLVNEEGTISVLRNSSGDDDWAKVADLLGEFRPSASMRPFWVRTPGAGSVLCITAVRGPRRAPVTGTSPWKVFLIDVANHSIAGQMLGKGIRPAPDSTSLLIVRNGALKLARL